MSLEQLVKEILNMMEQGEDVNSDNYDEAKKDYRAELKNCNSAVTLEKIATKNLFELPVDIILETSRRLVEVDRSADNLKLLASQLSLFEPEWHDEIEALFQEANNLDGLNR